MTASQDLRYLSKQENMGVEALNERITNQEYMPKPDKGNGHSIPRTCKHTIAYFKAQGIRLSLEQVNAMIATGRIKFVPVNGRFQGTTVGDFKKISSE